MIFCANGNVYKCLCLELFRCEVYICAFYDNGISKDMFLILKENLKKPRIKMTYEI
jgi:hypothetical protein